MPQFTTQRHVAHTPEQMYELVADIEKYPSFLPLCEDLVVRSRETIDGTPVIVADMTAGYKAIQESFTSRVILDRQNATINVTYIDGPFRYLENIWRFEPSRSGSIVHFHISYEFKSRMLGMLVGKLFDRAFRKFTGAFEARARQVYGAAPPATDSWLSGSLRRAEPPVTS